MIVFFNKETGKIVGTIGGRVHSPAEMNMFIGSADENEKIVCNWIQGEDGEFHPEIPIFAEMERLRDINKFTVDPATKTVIKVDSV